MTKNTLYFFALFLLFVSTGCEDWLNETNPNAPDKDSYWQNLTETNATLNGAYAALVSDYAVNIREEGPRGDMATPGYGRPTYSGEGAMWYTHTYTNTTTGIQKKWEILYMGIFRANQVIEGLEKMTNVMDQDLWNLQMAQARFLRGMYHFYLHSTYNKGSIIIKDRVPGAYEEMNLPLSTSEEVTAFFRKDLRYAYENLPVVYEEDADTGRATKGAAATLLGNSYLYEATLDHVGSPVPELVDSARVYFEDVVNSGEYALETDLSKLFTTAGEFNKESIFEISFNNTINPEAGPWSEDRLTNHLAFYYDGKGSNKNNVFPSLWATWAYKTEPKDMLDSRNMVEDADSGESVERQVSMRAAAMIGLAEDEQTVYYGGIAHEEIGFPTNDKRGQNGFSRYKIYNNHDYLTDESELPGGKQNSGKNVTLNRLAEVYLNLAECYIYQNRIEDALMYINKIRRRWALVNIGLSNGDASRTYDEVTYDQSSLLTRLQYVEKPLELSVEGHAIRWFDLRRWGMLPSIFEKHAAETWYSAGITTTKGVGAPKFKDYCTITNAPDPESPQALVMKDYVDAASSFNYEVHAWYPIPSGEVNTNPNLYK